MPARSTHPKESIAGFTLIETLLSLAITLLVLGIVYTSYHTVQRVGKSSAQREKGSFAAMKSIHDLSRDLSCALSINEDTPAIMLMEPNATNRISSLSFFTAMSEIDAESSPSWYTIEHVRYYVTTTANSLTLMKESGQVVGTNILNITTNKLVERIEDFALQAYYEGTWLPAWESTPEAPWPEAIKIAIKIEASEEIYETEVFLPVGHIITSSISRASAQQTPGRDQ